MKSSFFKTVQWSALAVIIAAGSGCGGGTTGTSSTQGGLASKIISGSVIDEFGGALGGAVVRLIDSGSSAGSAARAGLPSATTTDSLGRFTLGAEPGETDLNLEVEAADLAEQFSLSGLAGGVSIVGVQIQLARTQSRLSKVELIVNAIGGGDCEGIFGEARVVDFNGDTPPLIIIDQENPVGRPAVCTASLSVFREGAALEGTPFQLILVSQNFMIEKTVLAQGVTDAAGSGVVEFSLPLNEGEEPGSYFVVEAPTDLPSDERVGIVINPLLRN